AGAGCKKYPVCFSLRGPARSVTILQGLGDLSIGQHAACNPILRRIQKQPELVSIQFGSSAYCRPVIEYLNTIDPAIAAPACRILVAHHLAALVRHHVLPTIGGVKYPWSAVFVDAVHLAGADGAAVLAAAGQ